MDEVFGYIESILFADESFTVAKIKEPKKQELTAIVGAMPGVQVGETIQCQGEWTQHPKFGSQFKVSEFQVKVPTDVVGIQRYLESGMIKGIGPSYAGKIVAKFGLETLEVIDKRPEKLLSIAGIGEKRVARIMKCWDEQKEVREVMIFLRGHGVSPSLAGKIYRKYGSKAIEVMRENPYRVASEIKGIGFKSADKIAEDMGIPRNAPQRLESGIQYLLWELAANGHVCFPKDELMQQARELLAVDHFDLEESCDRLIADDAIIEEDGKLWIKPLFLSEVGIARELNRLMNGKCALRDVDVAKALSWVEKQLGIDLATEQRKGVAEAISQKMLILTGGPGTGKSTITNAILRILEKLTRRIFLAAPTGRAAKRMSEITRRKAHTIHSLLEMDFVSGGFKRGKDNPLACDLIIVDEASMIDTALMHNLLRAIPSEARVIFVGDIDQLPSVGPGNVLRDLIDSTCFPVVRLNEIFRQAKGSLIVTNAHKINKGEYPYLADKGDFSFQEEEDPLLVRERILELVKGQEDRFRVQVLCPMKKGPIGTEALNTLLQEKLNPSSQPLLKMGKRFHKGDKVMQTRNNYQKEAFNGDVGRILDIDFSDQVMKVDFYGREVLYEFSELDEVALAYAVSIHKFQGSECPMVVMPVHTSHFKMLHRNLLYTGITRGKRRVVLVGTKKAVAIAVNTEEVQKRHTGLKAQIMKFGTEALL